MDDSATYVMIIMYDDNKTYVMMTRHRMYDVNRGY